MQEIELSGSDIIIKYCPCCGTENISQEMKIKPCSHLQLFATSEGIEYDKNNIFQDFEHIEDLIKKLDDNYICVTEYVGAPSGMRSYMIYKFG